jgi:hypothetical protein
MPATFKRWSVVTKHDNQPMQECLFVHKSHAIKKLEQLPNPDKCEVRQIFIIIQEL